MIYTLFPKFSVRHEGLSFYGPRKSDKGADTDLKDNFCGPYLLVHNNLLLQCPCAR